MLYLHITGILLANRESSSELLTKFRSEIDQVLINKDDTQSPKISKSLIQEGDLTSKRKRDTQNILD